MMKSLGFIFLSLVLFIENLFFVVLFLMSGILFMFFYLHYVASSHWPQYFLFMVYLGGILMILLYLTSMVSIVKQKTNFYFLLLLFAGVSTPAVFFPSYYGFAPVGSAVLSSYFYLWPLLVIFLILLVALYFISAQLTSKQLPLRSFSL